MSRKYTVRCGCSTPHAITKEQRRYALRSLQMAYTMRDGAAIARIKDALKPCTVDRTFERTAALTLIKAMEGKRK